MMATRTFRRKDGTTVTIPAAKGNGTGAAAGGGSGGGASEKGASTPGGTEAGLFVLAAAAGAALVLAGWWLLRRFATVPEPAPEARSEQAAEAPPGGEW